MSIKCRNRSCGQDIQDAIRDACQESALVYRLEVAYDRLERPRAKRVFVNCPHCDELEEYPCPGTREE